MTTEEKRERLKTLLSKHDWYYDRSDSRDVYQRGAESYDAIMSLVRELPDGKQLYVDYMRSR